jgi:hypothetical protein
VASALLALSASIAGAQNLPSGFSIEFAPAWQSLRGPDYKGVNAGIGLEALGHYNSGKFAIGLGYRRDGHGLDFGEFGVPVPSNVSVDLTISGWVLEFRRAMRVDPESPAAVYLIARGSLLTQRMEGSSSRVRVALEASGFGAGLATGVFYRLSPIVDLKGEFGWDFVKFSDFEAQDVPEESTEVLGINLSMKVGARLRLSALSAATRRVAR